MLFENYENEQELLDEYKDNNDDPELEEMDERLADPRAYPHPKPWRWLRRVNIGCTVQCTKYHWCRLRSKEPCSHPPGCECTKFAWERK